MDMPKPEWLKIRAQVMPENRMVEEMLRGKCLHTVCEQANCPNINECYSNKTVTFMILGRVCTRNCRFCAVEKGSAQAVADGEPDMIAQAVAQLNLKHVVITSVTRDDLPDGGAGHFARVVRRIREENRAVSIETLVPDFCGSEAALATLIEARPNVINHNIETVPRLYPDVRPMADFEASVRLLANVKKAEPSIYTKSGIMVGLGEKTDEVLGALRALRKAGCDFLTIGQYLRPSKAHHPVAEYVTPEQFEAYKKAALDMGFTHVASGPFVRSSYHAKNAFDAAEKKAYCFGSEQ